MHSVNISSYFTDETNKFQPLKTVIVDLRLVIRDQSQFSSQSQNEEFSFYQAWVLEVGSNSKLISIDSCIKMTKVLVKKNYNNLTVNKINKTGINAIKTLMGTWSSQEVQCSELAEMRPSRMVLATAASVRISVHTQLELKEALARSKWMKGKTIKQNKNAIHSRL